MIGNFFGKIELGVGVLREEVCFGSWRIWKDWEKEERYVFASVIYNILKVMHGIDALWLLQPACR